jgi:AraC-like DNA-binding protein
MSVGPISLDYLSRLTPWAFNPDQIDVRGHHSPLFFDPKFPFRAELLSYPLMVKSDPLRCNWHEQLEIFVGVAGRGTFQIGSRDVDFGPGDIIVVDSLKLHGPRVFRGQERLRARITFKPELVCNSLSCSCDSILLLPFYSLPDHLDPTVRERDKAWGTIHGTLRKMLHCYSNEATSLEVRQAGCKAFLLQFLFDLVEHFGLTKLPSAGFKAQSETSIQFGRLYNYMQENYADHITVSQAADMIGLSYFQFMKFFRKATGTSFVTYLTRLRLVHAQRLLTETDRSIAAISADVGFSDQSYFDRRFRQHYQKSPRQLRAETGSFK